MSEIDILGIVRLTCNILVAPRAQLQGLRGILNDRVQYLMAHVAHVVS